MKRLTKKIGDNYCSQTGDFYDLYNKLGKLEDLEEELGCSLEVVFKALYNGIYTSESVLEPEYEMFEVRGIEKNGLSVISKLCGYAECDFLCKYKDYKKTWWLRENREE